MKSRLDQLVASATRGHSDPAFADTGFAVYFMKLSRNLKHHWCTYFNIFARKGNGSTTMAAETYFILAAPNADIYPPIDCPLALCF